MSAIANTAGTVDRGGIDHGVPRLNHVQLDRWDVVTRHAYLPARVDGLRCGARRRFSFSSGQLP